jgi:hypothetical protein
MHSNDSVLEACDETKTSFEHPASNTGWHCASIQFKDQTVPHLPLAERLETGCFSQDEILPGCAMMPRNWRKIFTAASSRCASVHAPHALF